MIYTIIVILAVMASVLMCAIVFIQESKGGGLASGFSSGNSMLGVRKTTDVVEKTTWSLAGIMVVLCVLSVFFLNNESATSVQSVTEMQAGAATEQAANPANQTAVPATDAMVEGIDEQAPVEGAAADASDNEAADDAAAEN